MRKHVIKTTDVEIELIEIKTINHNKMAIYLKLINKSTQQEVNLIDVDEEICLNVLKVKIHPRFWGGNVFNWYDSIGFTMASGMNLQSGELREHYENSDIWKEDLDTIRPIIDYLEANYISKRYSR